MVKSNDSGYKWFPKVFWLQIDECQIQFVIREHQVLNVLLKLTVSKEVSDVISTIALGLHLSLSKSLSGYISKRNER